MQSWLKSIWLNIHRAGLTKEEYEETYPIVAEENRRVMIVISAITATIAFIMFWLTFVNKGIEENRFFYSVLVMIGIAFCALCCNLIKGKRSLIRWLMYALEGVLYGAGIVLGTILSKTDQLPSVMYMVMLVAVPIVFCDRPIRSWCIMLGADVIFTVMNFHYKDDVTFIIDFHNTISYTILGVLLSMVSIRTKMANLCKRQKLAGQQKELEEAALKAEEASKAKSTFLFNMSHDIRTPMNAIVGFSNLLQKDDLSEEKRKSYIQKIITASGYLLDLINNVLETARIESGKVTIVEQENNIRTGMETAIDIFGLEAKKHDIAITLNIEITHEHVYYDKIKVEQIVLNVIGNAIKYTPEGGRIEVSLRELSNEKPEHGTYELKVKDNGIGISKAFLPHIFEVFSRENSETENKIVGTGLGLGIVKKNVECMGGTITVESEKGEGTEVTILIPMKYAQNQKNEASEITIGDVKDGLSGKRILLVDDHELNRDIAVDILSDAGIIVECAEDGDESVAILAEKPAGYYDVVLMDIQMPRMNGLDATREIRRTLDPEKAKVPIIAMTANAFDEDRKVAMDAGMDGFVPKPVEVPKLMAALDKILGEPEE